jgi:hypothetical protein
VVSSTLQPDEDLSVYRSGPLHLRGELHFTDLQRFARHVLDRKMAQTFLPRALRTPPRIGAFVVGAAATLTIVGSLLPPAPPLGQLVSILLVAVWVLIAVLFILFGITIVMNPRIMAKQPGMLIEREIVVDEDGFRSRSTALDVLHPWSSILEVDEIDTHFFVFVGPAVAHIVPKRFFASPEASQQFGEALRAGIAAER